MKNELEVREGAANDLTFNVQAELDFTLIGTKLKMAFSKIGGTNAFIVMPTEIDSEGMTIKEMVKAINDFGKGYDPSMQSDLDEGKVEQAVKDVSDATAQKTENAELKALNFDTITVKLRQAFLLLMTGKKMEYALEIDVLLDGVLPAQTFVNVEKLSVMVWNTNRAKILDKMDIIDVEKLLEENA